MESIARTKPNMSVLPRDILPVSPFGVLSQAFTEEILGRFESGLGMYPMYGLELLYPEEENGSETPGSGNVRLEVQLKLILQQLKDSGKAPAAERILEKAETLRLLREKTVVRQTPGAAGPGKPGTSTGAAAGGRYRPSGMYAMPIVSAGNDRPGTPVTAERPTGTKAFGTWQTGAEGTRVYLQNQALGSRQARTAPAVSAIRRGAAPARMGSPTVAGLPGRTGRSLAKVRFLTPQEADAAGRQTMNREKPAAGLTRRMEQAAVQAAEAVARAMAMEPQGMRIDDQPQQAPKSVEQAAPSRDSGAAANGGKPPGAHACAKEQTDRIPDVGRIESTARNIRMSSGQIGSPPDTELATSGAADYAPALRQDRAPGKEGSTTAAAGYLPLSLEHMESAAMPGQSTPIDGERLARAIEAAALGAEQAFVQSARDGRGEKHSAAKGKSEALVGSAGKQAGAAAAFASQAAGTAGPDGGRPIRMKRPVSSAKGAEEAAENTAPFVRQNWPAANSPGVLHDLDRLAISGAATGLTETDRGLAAPISTELAGRTPLTLEYLQELQKNDRQAAEQIQALAPKVLEKLLDTPGLRLLSKDIAVLEAESRKSRQTPYRRSQAAPRTADRGSQAGSTVSGGTAYRGTSGAAGNIAFAKPSAVGHGDFSQDTRLNGFTQSRNMGFPSVHASGAMTAGGMALLRADAAARSHTWGQTARLPVELAHMEPSPEAQAAAQRETGARQGALRKEIQRSLAGGVPGAVRSSQSASRGQTEFGQRAFNRGIATSPTRAGRRGFAARGPGQLTAVGHMGGFSRGRGTAFSAAPGAAAYGGMDQEALSAYPALSMEYGGPLAAVAGELRRTAEREISQMGAVWDMGLHTPAARAMGEKGTPETMQTLDLMTQPQIQEQQVVWENPYMRSAPAEMAHHQNNPPHNQQRTQHSRPQIRMSDAEIRRTADKVFRLVQEKIINERRRIGRM